MERVQDQVLTPCLRWTYQARKEQHVFGSRGAGNDVIESWAYLHCTAKLLTFTVLGALLLSQFCGKSYQSQVALNRGAVPLFLVMDFGVVIR